MSRIDYEFLFKISVSPPYCDKIKPVDWWTILYTYFSAFFAVVTLYLRITIINNAQNTAHTHDNEYIMNLLKVIESTHHCIALTKAQSRLRE